MLKSAIILAAAIAVAVPSASAKMVTGHQTTGPVMQNNSHINVTLTYTLSCITFQVGGDAPSVQFENNGPGIVPAGTVVHWVVKQSSGDYTLPYPMQVHQLAVLNGVARSGLGSCSISAVH